jgi:hypothetical protein
MILLLKNNNIKQTFKVITPYKSKAYGELSLKANEYIFASAITTKDNFIKGFAIVLFKNFNYHNFFNFLKFE